MSTEFLGNAIILIPALSPSPEGGGGSPWMSFVPLVLVLFIFYFLIIRPQAKKQKTHQTMLASLAKGDRVLTSGGIFANVLNVKDDMVVATIAEGVKVEIAKNAVSAVIKTKK